MLISAHGAGGFAGQEQRIEIDTAQAMNGESIEMLLRDLRFFSAPGPTSGRSAIGADMEQWDITVRDGARQHTVHFVEDGNAVTAPWIALLEQIRAAA